MLWVYKAELQCGNRKLQSSFCVLKRYNMIKCFISNTDYLKVRASDQAKRFNLRFPFPIEKRKKDVTILSFFQVKRKALD